MSGPTGFPFEEIHFTECRFAAPEWRGSELVVAARSLYLCGDHPLSDERRPRSGLLVFGDVARSTRTVYEYSGDPAAPFRPSYVVEDGGTHEDGGDLEEYRFGGVLEEPHAWIEWTIRARRFDLELGVI
ncbi:MAG TPA: hypothetical protein VEW26_13375 [Allosphingosinicella sp.]|nr:hypothetical protein [Allosphingosinicella sp.]